MQNKETKETHKANRKGRHLQRQKAALLQREADKVNPNTKRNKALAVKPKPKSKVIALQSEPESKVIAVPENEQN